MSSFSIVLACFLSLLTARVNCDQKVTQDIIGFPEKEENPNLNNKENRQPVFLPSMCPENQLYYPGDQKDDWICDCRPSYIYQPATDKCWPAYRKGPCEEGYYLVLPPKSYVPVCEKNPCQIDSLVVFNSKCEMLDSRAPCAHLYPNSAALGVNATTLQVDCVKSNLDTKYFAPTMGAPNSNCPPGFRRDQNQRCIDLGLN